jgi:GT2 family glycosyltransferase
VKTDVVIATFNRAEPLRRTLDGLARQTLQDFEVIVADDCSTVPASRSLASYEAPFPLRVLRTSSNGGPAAARNLAVESSSADLILFIDDDVVPDIELVAEHRRNLAALGARGVSIGPLRAPGDWKPTPWNRWEADSLEVEYGRMAGGDYRATWRQFFTGNAMLHRAAFVEVGGFDPAFKRAEDIEFAYRLAKNGASFGFEPRAIGWHYARRTLASWRNIPSQYAECDVRIASMHPELHWDETLAKEEQRRHPLTRLVDNAAGVLHARRPAASCAIAAARAAHAFRARRLSNSLLSLTFQLEYARTYREKTLEQRFNRASTA